MCLDGLSKTTKNLSGDTRFPADIRPGYLQITNNKRYLMIQLAGDFRILDYGVGDVLQPGLSLDIPELFFLSAIFIREDVVKNNDFGNHILVQYFVNIPRS
jgi:hypothetical protein